MKLKESYAKEMQERLNDLYNDKTVSKEELRNICLADIVIMLALIADILEGRNADAQSEDRPDA